MVRGEDGVRVVQLSRVGSSVTEYVEDGELKDIESQID